jgi:predicted DsbA family dithiol-disulfide isomerase
LEASEYARDMGKYEHFHDRVFHAYFTEALDIGNAKILCDIASGCGLDASEMMHALNDGCYKLRLDEARKEWLRIQLTVVPTYIINGTRKIVGAQPVAVFTDILDKIAKTNI